ncbi:LuxR C-terminal-related transcriptional regulator [Streptomyces sp. NPDC053474]|uniref:LuxR C-terminal-related transcriptional regulator n=1 Tax=Streptomyces sp. NPDC053474 TaxID=3365704 RepID=UPI0037CD786E
MAATEPSPPFRTRPLDAVLTRHPDDSGDVCLSGFARREASTGTAPEEGGLAVIRAAAAARPGADASGAPAPGAVLVTGPPGTGKSWLLSRAAHELGSTGRHRVVQALTTSGTHCLPLGALAHVLPPGGPARASSLLRAATETLCARSGRRRLVVVADDAQFLDEVSTALLYRMASEGRCLALLATRARPQLPAPFRQLGKQGKAVDLVTSALARDGARDFAEAVLGGPVARPTADRMWRATGGEQEMLSELVAAGRAADALVPVSGVWTWRGPWTVGARLAELADERLGRPAGRALELVETVAHGDPLPLALLTAAFTATEMEAAEATGAIRTVNSPDGPLVTLPVPLLAEAVRARCPTLRAAGRRRRLALLASADLDTALRTGGPVPPRTVALCRAGGVAVPPALLVHAAREAYAAGDFSQAHQIATEALAADARSAEAAAGHVCGVGPQGAEAASLLWRAGLLDAEIDAPAGGGVPAAAASLRAHPCARVRDELALGDAWAVFCRAGREAEALRMLRAAARTTVAPERLRAAEAFMLACAGRSREALRRAADSRDTDWRTTDSRDTDWRTTDSGGADWRATDSRATGQRTAGDRADTPGVGAAREAPPPEPAVLAWCAEAVVQSRQGQYPAALAALDRADAATARAATACPWLRTVLAHVRCETYLLSGEPRQAVRVATDAYEDALAREWSGALLRACVDLARAARLQGWIGVARRAVHDGLSLLDARTAGAPAVPSLHREHAALAALAGDARLTAHALEQAAAAQGHDHFDTAPGVWARLTRAWAALAEGDRTRAGRAAWAVAAEVARDPDLAGFAPLALHDAVRLGQAAAAARRLRTLGGDARHACAGLARAHAEAGADRDAAGLVKVAARYTERAMYLHAAEAYADAAVARRSAGRDGEAQRLRARAAVLLDRAGGAPAVTVPSDGSARLTPRERSVAQSAAGGLTSQQIAALLCLSVRTVDNHLHRAYGKLGLSGRGQLAALFGPCPDDLPEAAPSGAVPPGPGALRAGAQNAAASSRNRRRISSPSVRNSR